MTVMVASPPNQQEAPAGTLKQSKLSFFKPPLLPLTESTEYLYKHCCTVIASKERLFIQRAAKYSAGVKDLENSLGCGVEFIFDS